MGELHLIDYRINDKCARSAFCKARRAFVSSIRPGSLDSGTTRGNLGAEGMGNEQSPGYSHSMMLW